MLGAFATSSVTAQSFSAVEFQPSPIPSENILQLEQLVRKAAAQGASVVVLPENAVAGPLTESGLLEMSSAQATRRFGFLAKEVRAWILLPVPQRTGKEGKWQTTSLLFNTRSYVSLRQNKLALRGDIHDLETIGFGAMRIGTSSGDDLAVTIPRLAQLGADTILVFTAWTQADKQKQHQAQELAKQYGVNLVIATLGANAAIVSRDGTLLSQASDGLVLHSIESASSMETQLGLPADPTPRNSRPSTAVTHLGKQLFDNPKLSSNGLTSCASCHNPAKAFVDGRPRARGVLNRQGEWNTRSLLNASFHTHFGWQGKILTLEQEVLHPFGNSAEMETSPEALVESLRGQSSYRTGFRAAFGSDEIRIEQISASLAAYVRTLQAGDSDFDRFTFGGDLTALNKSAARGRYLFFGKAECGSCHASSRGYALFTDHKLHNTGVGHSDRTSSNDGGLYITPMLRNISLTAPYMHDGSLKTLEEVVAFYDRGANPNPSLDKKIHPLNLTAQERADLVEFLRSLTTNSSRQQTASSIDIGSRK